MFAKTSSAINIKTSHKAVSYSGFTQRKGRSEASEKSSCIAVDGIVLVRR